MTEGTKKVGAYVLYLWIGTGALVAFNTAAAMSHRASLVHAALAMTGMVTMAAIGLAIWAGLAQRRKRPEG